MKSMIWILLFYSIDSICCQCGRPPCSPLIGPSQLPSAYYQSYQIPQQQSQPQINQPTIQYYLTPGNSYAIPSQPPSVPQVLAQIDKDTSIVSGKSNYDDFEKELEKLKPTASIIKTEQDLIGGEVNTTLGIINGTGTTQPQMITYIREYSAFAPESYLPKPLPYRPVPFIPKGCPVVGPQYIQPIPYYPRGYVQPVTQPQIQTSYVQPPPQPQPQPLPTVVQPQQQIAIHPPTQPQPFILPPPINDCCGKCRAPCKYRSRKNVIALASKIFSAQFVPRREKDEEDEPKDPKCNSEQLKDIMNRFITRTVSLSKRLIQKNAEKELGDYFSVFCSTDDFSYVARSEVFCQHQKLDIICYAFKHK